MNKKIIFLMLVFVIISGCIEPGYRADEDITPPPGRYSKDYPGIDASEAGGGNGTSPQPASTGSKSQTRGAQDISSAADQTDSPQHGTAAQADKSELLIDRIAIDLRDLYNKKWNTLYQEDELDCSRMSVYLWDYIRTNYHVAPKIIVSYQRQHAWLALKVSDMGNSSNYSRWNIRGTDYYYLEATIPKIVADDNQRFLINDQAYTSSQFYDAAIYIFETPQDANDFHAENSGLRGWNQEFRLKKDDLDKIDRLLG